MMCFDIIKNKLGLSCRVNIYLFHIELMNVEVNQIGEGVKKHLASMSENVGGAGGPPVLLLWTYLERCFSWLFSVYNRFLGILVPDVENLSATSF